MIAVGIQLQRRRAFQFRVMRYGCSKEIVGSNIHYDEMVFYDSYAVSARLQGLPAEIEWYFGDEIGLVLLLNAEIERAQSELQSP